MRKSILTAISLGSLALSAKATMVLTPVNLAGATASESSNVGFPADRAIDGQINGVNPDFTHTSNGPSEWWRVELPANANVDVVRIFNRTDCCSTRLDGAVVKAFSDSGLTNNVFTSSAISGAPRRSDYTFPSTQSVRVIEVAHQNQFLSLAEVQLFTRQDVFLPWGTNLTQARVQGMMPSMSSAWTGGDYASGGVFPADYAVDMVTGNSGNFTHTAGGQTTDQWWKADFNETFFFEEVEIQNRVGCCAGRLRDLTVEVLDSGGSVIWSSPLINKDNVLGGGSTDFINGPSAITVDLVALNSGAPVIGNQVRITRAISPFGSGDDAHIVAFSEVNIIGGTIPEPTTAAIAGLGLGLLALRRRRNA